MNEEKNSIALGTSTIICEVRADCMTWPLSTVVSASVADVGLVGGDDLGPDRHAALEVLARRSTAVPARCQSRAEASLRTTNPAIASRALPAGMYRPPAPMTIPSSPS